MPQMGGAKLAAELAPDRPDMKVLFVSGYAEATFQRHGEIDVTTHFLQKPFSLKAMARKIREVLDAGKASSAAASIVEIVFLMRGLPSRPCFFLAEGVQPSHKLRLLNVGASAPLVRQRLIAASPGRGRPAEGILYEPARSVHLPPEGNGVTYVLLALLAGAVVYSLLSVVAALRYLSVRPPSPEFSRTDQHPQTARRTRSRSRIQSADFFRAGLSRASKFFSQCEAQDDPAVPIVESLRREYPKVPSRLLVTGESPYPNAKVYSLEQMLAAAANDLVVMSDSDIRVTPNLLKTVAAEFQDAGLGVATCPYRAVAGPVSGRGSRPSA